MIKYLYGTEGQEIYTDNDPCEAAMYSCENLGLEEIEIVEMKISKASGERFCTEYNVFIEGGIRGDCRGCDEYKPRNGKNGICIYRSWGLIETGRILLIDKNGDIIKTISPRKKEW